MGDRIIVRRHGHALVPVGPHDIEALQELPNGRELAANVVVPRNIKLHRKAFAMLNLTFDYWQPSNLVSSVEQQTVNRLSAFLVRSGLDGEAVKALCSEFMGHLERSRESLEGEKSREAFREFITIEAGYFDIVLTPGGPRKRAKSWRFGSMDDQTFSAMYSAIFAACWRLVLSQHFDSADEAEAAAEQLLQFD